MIIIITKAVFILTGYPLMQIQKAICSIVYVTTEPFTNLTTLVLITIYVKTCLVLLGKKQVLSHGFLLYLTPSLGVVVLLDHLPPRIWRQNYCSYLVQCNPHGWLARNATSNKCYNFSQKSGMLGIHFTNFGTTGTL